MPYYFAAEIAWLFVVWLIVGLPFRHAAVVSFFISFMYILGGLLWDFAFAELAFGAMMLAFVNGFGALACYQLEFAVRTSFLDKKVLGELAELDGLTGLNNRRSYDKYIQRIWRQSRREQSPLTVMLIDIDHFKSFNDRYGHQAGDDALKAVADVIRKSAQRPLDFAARFGGEEFALVLYGGPVDDYGRELPEQLRESIRGCKIRHESSPTDEFLTVSIGVAMVMPEAKRSMAGAIQMADEALYQAKEEGRNTVVLMTSDDFKFQTGSFRARQKATA
jgi:diguanylate cyclase (GGDEF)-like protein